ncbi:hypothetical protein FB192DRAFT_1063951 [Mucor lusitanicus]|uniref:Uncharacterized protein n=1 Tax=Mucor circinelloides f. lusitanicus TaxID=29924 RepID=A0A8H4BNF8_MUCCL|nr:hypothetical protein FB192DRAFT_1063951 [Mucor lusitanicus]
MVILMHYMLYWSESLGQLFILHVFCFGCLNMTSPASLRIPMHIRCVCVHVLESIQHTLARNSIRDCSFMMLIQRACK